MIENTFCALIATVVILMGIICEYHTWQTMKKYYPGMTYMEYCLVGDKIRLTPGSSCGQD